MRTKLGRLPPLKRREIPFENRLRDALSDVGVMFVKAKPTLVGWPDRQALGFCNIRLVELKAEGEDPNDTQLLRHAEILQHSGQEVVVVRAPHLDHAVQRIIRALRER